MDMCSKQCDNIVKNSYHISACVYQMSIMLRGISKNGFFTSCILPFPSSFKNGQRHFILRQLILLSTLNGKKKDNIIKQQITVNITSAQSPKLSLLH